MGLPPRHRDPQRRSRSARRLLGVRRPYVFALTASDSPAWEGRFDILGQRAADGDPAWEVVYQSMLAASSICLSKDSVKSTMP